MKMKLSACWGALGQVNPTLLRTISGLIQPSRGQIVMRDTPVTGPRAGPCDGVSKFCFVSLVDCIRKCGNWAGGATCGAAR